MIFRDVVKSIKDDNYRNLFDELYGPGDYTRQKERYLLLLAKFSSKFGEFRDIRIISSPGRTELAGNHTDHNHGRVLAASIQLDSLAIVSQSDDPVVRIFSEGFSSEFTVGLDCLESQSESEDPTSSLIRGVLAIFRSRGLAIGGFHAYVASDVLIGSGLSSSASFEVLIGKILGVLYNGDSIGPVDLAIIGQKAENEFLGKPCGLMDQVACAYGGIVSIDFRDPSSPLIDSIHYSFEEKGYNLLVIDTGGDHADLTDDYAAIPAEMKSIAGALGGEVCRDVEENVFMDKIPELTARFGERAVLRALHFFSENDRVAHMVDFLKDDDVDAYLEFVRKSGDSSYKYLQNVFTSKYSSSQRMSLAIALTETFPHFIGAVRVHGGGFAGTVQVYIAKERFDIYKAHMEHIYGLKSVTLLRIRQIGVVAVI